MLTEWLLPQVEEHLPPLIFQRNSDPTHFHKDVGDHLNATLPGRCIGRAGNHDLPIAFWPLRSPDLKPLDLFLWVYVRDICVCSPLPQQLNDLKKGISDTVELITEDV